MIEIINLKKQFKTKGKNGGKTVKTAIDNLSLAISDGEIFGLLGPNGAGKTTLVSMLAMLMRPCGGENLYDGKNAFANETFVKSQIGVVPQHINFDQDLTVWENMELHGRLHHLPEKERHARIDELLEYVGLQERRRESIKALSGGMKRRLLIVRALIHRPKVLFLDEPTVALDPQVRRRIWDLIRRRSRKFVRQGSRYKRRQAGKNRQPHGTLQAAWQLYGRVGRRRCKAVPLFCAAQRSGGLCGRA